MNEPKYFIQIAEGERAKIFDEVARAISDLGGIYRKHGTGKLVFAASGMWFIITAPWLGLHLARHIVFAKNGYPVDPPSWLVQAVLAAPCELQIPSVDTSKLPSTQIEERP
jgi:hypothetical protein